MAVRSQIQQLCLLQGRFAVSHHPPGIESQITMRSPSHVNIAIEEEKRGALRILCRIEDHVSVLGVVSSSGIARGDLCRAPADLRSRCDIKCMQSLMVISGGILT